MAPSAKSSRGRGGGSQAKKRPPTHQRNSSTSSNPTTSNYSPPSVGRKSLPPQYRVSPGAQHSASASEPRREIPDPRRPLVPPPSMLPQRTQSRNSGHLAPVLHEPEEDEEEEDHFDNDQVFQDDDDGEDAPPQPPSEAERLRIRDAQISLDALLTQPGRKDYLLTLSPTKGEGLWFGRDDTLIVKKIASILKEKFDGLWYSWSVVPRDAQDRYFIQLAHRFTWNPMITHLVRERFDKVCKDRLKGLISYVRRKRKRPCWIREELYKVMDAYWDTEDARERSQNASNSRNSPRDGLGPHVHVGGPKSHAQIEHNMAEELGRPVSIAEVFMKTHTRKDGSYVDRKAQKVGEAYHQNLKTKLSEVEAEVSMTSDGASQTPQLTTEQMNQIFLQSTVQNDRGTPYGLGSLSELYGKGKTTCSYTSSSSTITHLEEQLKEAQAKIAEQAELNRKREAESQENQKQLDWLMKYLKNKDPELREWSGTTPPPGCNDDGEGLE